MLFLKKNALREKMNRQANKRTTCLGNTPLTRMRNQCRPGLTLVELLVVISIICILTALLMPALFGARESVRKLRCTNNLRQIGLALTGYNATYRQFPCALAGMNGVRNQILGAGHHSVAARLLPMLCGETLFNQINFECGDVHPFDGLPFNTTAYHRQLSILQCPSDPYVRHQPIGGNSYRVCLGVSPVPADGPQAGLFVFIHWKSDAGIRDGLSRTAAFSERLTGDQNSSQFNSGDYWYAGVPMTPEFHRSDAALSLCQSILPNGRTHDSTAGISWFHAGFHTTWYNHIASPNHKMDCSAWTPETMSYNIREGVHSSSSLHSGMVQVMFADGSVSSVAEDIDLSVWRSMGTCSGDEIVERF